MKALIVLLAITASINYSPAILTRRIEVPQPTVSVFSKKSGKFLKFL